jgi:pilus assembly protein Flp/PilA
MKMPAAFLGPAPAPDNRLSLLDDNVQRAACRPLSADPLKTKEAMGMQSILLHFLHDEAGAIAIEYALIAGSIALLIVAVIGVLGGVVLGTFATVNTNMP